MTNKKEYKQKFLSTNRQKKEKGFTLIETLVSISVGIIVLTVAYTSFIIGQKANKKGNLNTELSQNGRIALDRISRDIRQTGQITTVLPETFPDPAQTEIMFEDGHVEEIQYIRYYTYQNELRKEVRHYYFPSDPDIWVDFEAKDGNENPAEYIIDSDQVIAQNISYINFYGERSISIELTVEKNEKQIKFKTKNFGRNL